QPPHRNGGAAYLRRLPLLSPGKRRGPGPLRPRLRLARAAGPLSFCHRGPPGAVQGSGARDAVRADEQRIAAIEAERRKLRPGVARMQALLTEMKIELKRQEKAQAKEEIELQRQEKDVERLREEERKASEVQRDWDALYKVPADKA